MIFTPEPKKKANTWPKKKANDPQIDNFNNR